MMGLLHGITYIQVFPQIAQALHITLQIIEGIAPTLLLGLDFQKLRSEGFLSPFHPRYPDKLTNSAHPAVLKLKT